VSSGLPTTWRLLRGGPVAPGGSRALPQFGELTRPCRGARPIAPATSFCAATPRVPAPLWLLATLCLLTACGPRSPCGPDSAVVETVVDGDTVVLADGRKLRLLLVDTPETTQGKSDCFGVEARAFTAAAVEGRTVALRYDAAACVDHFGRTLAYVSVSGRELNTQLVQQGFACTLFVSPGGAARAEEFATYESEAKTARIGMWGECSQIPCSTK
jgi:micrococcal nuclease